MEIQDESEGRSEHGEGGREGGGEHGEGGRESGREGAGNRPTDPALRPLYNQLQLLRNEIRTLSRNLRGGGQL